MARKNKIGGILRRLLVIALLTGLWYLVRQNETENEAVEQLTIDNLPVSGGAYLE